MAKYIYILTVDSKYDAEAYLRAFDSKKAATKAFEKFLEEEYEYDIDECGRTYDECIKSGSYSKYGFYSNIRRVKIEEDDFPQAGDSYYSVSTDKGKATVQSYVYSPGNSFDECFAKSKNCFETSEEAQEIADQFNKLLLESSL